jgi:hypothetical protein
VHEAFVTMAVGGAVRGGVAALVWALALPAVVWVFAPRLTSAMER